MGCKREYCDCYNGFVVACEPPQPNSWPVSSWCANSLKLLDNMELWRKFSAAALEKVKEYNYAKAAEGFIKAIDYATNK